MSLLKFLGLAPKEGEYRVRLVREHITSRSQKNAAAHSARAFESQRAWLLISAAGSERHAVADR